MVRSSVQDSSDTRSSAVAESPHYTFCINYGPILYHFRDEARF